MKENLTAETNIITQIAESDDLQNQGVTENFDVSTPQTPEQNREFAKIRRNQEKEKFEKDLTEKVKLSTLNEIALKLNPNLDYEFKSIDEFDKFLQEKNNFDYQKKTDTKLEDEKNWFLKDKDLFFQKNPDFDEKKFNELLNDSSFEEFSCGKVGEIPLYQIYQEYNSFMKKVEKLATQKAERMYLKRLSSPGSLSQNPYNFNSLSWSDMSEQEFEKAISNAKKGFYSNKK